MGFKFSEIPNSDSSHCRGSTHQQAPSELDQTDMSNDRPPRPISIDIVISHNLGLTIALDAAPAQLQASKRSIEPSQSEAIEQLIRKNDCLRQELTYQHKMHDVSICLAREARNIVKRLRQAILKFRKAHKQIDKDFGRELQQSRMWGHRFIGSHPLVSERSLTYYYNTSSSHVTLHPQIWSLRVGFQDRIWGALGMLVLA